MVPPEGGVGLNLSPSPERVILGSVEAIQSSTYRSASSSEVFVKVPMEQSQWIS